MLTASGDAHYLIRWFSRLHEAGGDIASAIADLRHALKRDDDFAQALFNLAQLELQFGNSDAAVALFDRYLRLDPPNDWREIATKARTAAAGQLRARPESSNSP